MARLSHRYWSVLRSLGWRAWTLVWRRSKYAGVGAIAGVLMFAAGIGILGLTETLLQRLAALGNAGDIVLPTRQPGDGIPADDGGRYAIFQSYLADPDAVPDALKDLLSVAEESRITLSAGEYRREPDPVGGYLRYQIALPVTGEADAEINFMLAALRKHKSLALESVSFHRERRDSRTVEARIQLVLLTRLPSEPGTPQNQGRTP